MKKQSILFFLLILFASIGCKDNVKEDYLLQINQMEKELDSLTAIFEEMNTQLAQEIQDSIQFTLGNIKEWYNRDTIPFELAEQLNDYKDVRTVLNQNSGNYAKIKEALPATQKKLKELHHDIDKGVNDRDKYEEFLTFEKEKVGKIKTLVKYYDSTNSIYILKYDSLHPVITSYSQSLKEK